MENTIKEMKEHESLLLRQSMEFDKKLAVIEEQQRTQDKNLETIHQSILQQIEISVKTPLETMQKIIDKQEETQHEILRIQGKQSEQIDNIKTTLDHFSEISKKVDDHETRIVGLEKRQQNELEIRKERIKGWWAIAGAIVSGIVSIATVLITVFSRGS